MKLNWKQNWKKLLIAGAVVVLLAAGGGTWYFLGHNSSDPVYVYPFEFVGMTEYWGDSRESYGPVSTDRMQTVFLSETQQVNEILVSQGDTVKKGDLLMTFDTTLSDLQVERKRLEVEKLKLQLEDAQTELKRINAMKPMVIYETESTPSDPFLGSKLSGSYQIYADWDHDGSSSEKTMVCWLGGGVSIDSDLLEAIRAKAELNQNQKAEQEYLQNYVPPETEPPVETLPPETTGEAEGEAGAESGTENNPGTEIDPGTEGEQGSGESGSGTQIPPYQHFTVDSFYVIFKQTQGDMSLGGKITWQGIHASRNGSGIYSMKFFNASGMADFTVTEPAEEEDSGPHIDYNSGYTAAQISQMRTEQQKTIKDLEFKLKMAEAEFKIMQAEVSDGNVYAQTDGHVISVLTEDEAKMNQQPILKVSGGGGFCVEGSVSELERDELQIGQEVTISDWQTGMSYSGVVSEIRDFPNGESGYYGAGNPNVSRYPYLVFVDESADLREGTYVSVSYSASGSSGIYLQKPFLRTEHGESFVYILGENGRLEKRVVTTGKALWGSYVEVTDGLSQEDLVAFPYGKNVRPGVKAMQGDLSNLYSY